MSRTTLYRFVAIAALFTSGCSEAPTGRDSSFNDRGSDDGDALKIATWNMEWLDRTNGAGETPRGNGDYQKLAEYADVLDADIIAIQEVDGPEAAQRVFDPAIYDFHMSSRNSKQRTGFAYRKSLDVSANPDYTALDLGNLRYGTDIEVTVDGETLRLLNVHLKSGCFSSPLNSGGNSCSKLSQQAGPLEDWIDARASEGVRFMVLGDFNRRLFSSSNDDLWTRLDDGSPAGAELSSPTDTGTALCNNSKFPQFIDHLVTGSLATESIVPGSFDQLTYSNADSSNFELSDHCPISIELELGGGVVDPPPPGGASCTGSCGNQTADGCWCDSECANFGDCCADKVAVCDAPPPPPDPEPDPNSCEGQCDGQAPGGCWCDDKCEGFGNCCDDKVDQCGAAPDPEPDPDPIAGNSCEARCTEQAPDGCWCDSQCDGFGDCCADKTALCG